MTKYFSVMWKSATVLGAVGLVVALGYAGMMYHLNNYHTVVTDEVYRAAQFSGDDLAGYKQKDSIRSVINLRGPAPKAGWYKDEVQASKKLGIRHIDFRMSSGKGLDALEAQRLVALMRLAPKPVLIHCHSGANRTGLAAALYLVAVKGATPAQAQAQLSLKYGHFNFRFSPAYAMDDTLRRFIRAHETGAAIPVMTVADAR